MKPAGFLSAVCLQLSLSKSKDIVAYHRPKWHMSIYFPMKMIQNGICPCISPWKWSKIAYFHVFMAYFSGFHLQSPGGLKRAVASYRNVRSLRLFLAVLSRSSRWRWHDAGATVAARHRDVQGGAPPVISWFIIPITIDITPINPSYGTYKPT